MSQLTIGDAYRQFVQSLKGTHEHDKAMQAAIGGVRQHTSPTTLNS